VEQLRVFPKGKHDDGPDALEMAVRFAKPPRTAKVFIVGGRGSSWDDQDWHPFYRAMRGG